MSTTARNLLKKCIKDARFRGFLDYWALKIKERHSKTIGHDDAKQILWEDLLMKLCKYDPDKSELFGFARGIVWKKSIDYIRERGNLKHYNYQSNVQLWAETHVVDYAEFINSQHRREEERSYANIMLDFIEKDLRSKDKTALAVFILLRKGHTGTSAARELGISPYYACKTMTTIKKVSSKYT